jgi:hypothetical protein
MVSHVSRHWLQPGSSANFGQGTFLPERNDAKGRSLLVFTGSDRRRWEKGGGGVWIFVVPMKFPLYWANSNRALDKTIMNLVVAFSKEL